LWLVDRLINDYVFVAKKRTLFILSGIVNFLKFYKKYEDELDEAEICLVSPLDVACLYVCLSVLLYSYLFY
jgi:hypothetical protein